MAKRPSGLGKASKNKKIKPEDDSKKEVKPEEEPELQIELQEDTEDEELAEVYGLYTKLRADRDPRVARGLVHESDQLLRSRDEQGKALPPKFHVVYAGGLFTLAAFEEKDKKEFVETALERLQTGLEGSPNPDVIGTAAYELVQFAHTELQQDKPALSDLGKKAYDQALKLLNEQEKSDDVELARASVLLVSLMDDLGNESATVLPIFQTFVASKKEDTKRMGYKCLAQNKLTEIAPKLALLEGDDEQEDEDEQEIDPKLVKQLQGSLKQVVEHLKKAVSDEDPDSYVMLAETYLELDGVNDSTEFNGEALRLLKKAQILGVDGLRDVIESVENAEE